MFVLQTLSALGVDPGDNILLLDGVVLQDTDVYNVLEVVTSECHLVEGLHRLGLQPENHIEVLKTSVHSEHKTFAVDVRSEAVMVGHVTCHVIRYSVYLVFPCHSLSTI